MSFVLIFLSIIFCCPVHSNGTEISPLPYGGEKIVEDSCIVKREGFYVEKRYKEIEKDLKKKQLSLSDSMLGMERLVNNLLLLKKIGIWNSDISNQKGKHVKNNCAVVFTREILKTKLLEKVREKKLPAFLKSLSIDLTDGGIHLKGKIGTPIAIDMDLILSITMNEYNVIDIYIEKLKLVGINLSLLRTIIFDYLRKKLNDNKIENVRIRLVENGKNKGIRIVLKDSFFSGKDKIKLRKIFIKKESIELFFFIP